MKNRYITYILISISIFYYGCYEDKGNYNYQEVNDLYISGIENTYWLVTLKDTLKINPEIHSLLHDQFDYKWYTIQHQSTEPVYNLISEEKNLSYLTTLKPGNHYLFFSVTDKITGISSFRESMLTVTTEFTDGFLVLHDDGEVSDFDLFDFQGDVKRNIMEAVHGEPMQGTGVCVGYSPRYLQDPQNGRYYETKCVVPMTSKDVKVLRASTMEILMEFDDMFFLAPTECIPQHFMSARYDIAVINDGTIYNLPIISYNSNKMFEPYSKNYKFSPKFFGHDAYTYAFEENTGSIMQLSRGNLNPICEGLEMKLLAGGLVNWECHCLLQDRYDSSILYHAKQVDFSNVEVKTLPKNLKASNAKFHNNNLNVHYFYFTPDNEPDKLYYLDVNSGSESLAYNFAGEEITFIAHINTPYGASIDYLFVATFLNGNYKVYQFTLENNLPSPSIEPNIMEGEGKASYLLVLSSLYSMTNQPNVY